jgi:hypothetical protein
VVVVQIVLYFAGVCVAAIAAAFAGSLFVESRPASVPKKAEAPTKELRLTTSRDPNRPPVWIAPTPHYKYPNPPPISAEAAMAFEPHERKEIKKSRGRPDKHQKRDKRMLAAEEAMGSAIGMHDSTPIARD